MLSKIENIFKKNNIKLELGCGPSKKTGYIGIEH